VTQTFATIAQNASEAAYPALWRGLRLCWSASLGQTGDTLQTAVGTTTGTFSGTTAASIWQRRFGKLCLDFDGTDDEAIISGSDRYRLGSRWTMAIWWQTDQASLSANNPIITSAGYFSSGDGSFVFRPSSTTNIQFASYELGGTNLEFLSTCPVPTIGQGWHQTILHCDGSTLRVQHDGQQLSSAVSHTKQINDLQQGLRFSDDHNNSKIDGSFAEAAFWSRDLTQPERLQLWRSGPGEWLARKRRRVYGIPTTAVKPYLFLSRGQVIGGGIG
jgi:hypothetical protein